MRRIEPGPGQESVWDYPRPPRIDPCARRVRVTHSGLMIADSTRAVRVLETAGPPTIYVPPEDVDMELLVAVEGTTFCEWKGVASYFDVATSERAAWMYEHPTPAFTSITGWPSFYPGRVECYLDDERVRPQPGRFYGGWVTDDLVGPFKGEPGSEGW